jgi:hypothetical protein
MKKTVFLYLLFAGLVGCSNDQPAAPSVEKRPVELELHGDPRTDDY